MTSLLITLFVACTPFVNGRTVPVTHEQPIIEIVFSPYENPTLGFDQLQSGLSKLQDSIDGAIKTLREYQIAQELLTHQETINDLLSERDVDQALAVADTYRANQSAYGITDPTMFKGLYEPIVQHLLDKGDKISYYAYRSILPIYTQADALVQAYFPGNEVYRQEIDKAFGEIYYKKGAQHRVHDEYGKAFVAYENALPYKEKSCTTLSCLLDMYEDYTATAKNTKHFFEGEKYVEKAQAILEEALESEPIVDPVALTRDLPKGKIWRKWAGIEIISGGMHEMQNAYFDALEKYKKARELCGQAAKEGSPCYLLLPALDNNEAIVYGKLGDYKKSFALFAKAIAAYKQARQERRLESSYGALAYAQYSDGKYEEAKKSYEISLKYSNGSPGSYFAYWGLANIAEEQGDRKAEADYRLLYKQAKEAYHGT